MGQTKTTRSISATGLFLLIMMTVGLYSCTRTQKDIIPSADYAPYVNAYTGGVISQNSTIRIELTHDQPMVDMNNELKSNPFSFSPSLKGKAYWVSNNTIEFVPEEGALKPGTPENEIISTISVATSAIVTTLVIVAGVILMIPLRPVLENPVLVPAFDNVVPALFGALGLKYFMKSPKIAAIPVLSMTLLCVLVPAAISQTSLLMIPAGGMALLIGWVLFKKGKL